MNVAIVGGSLTGLAAANVLIRLGATVTVFEKYPFTFEKRGASLGFVDVALWEYIRGERMMRLGKPANRRQGAYYYGDLWKFLYDGLPEGCVKLNHEVNTLGNDLLHPTINDTSYDFVIVADGGWSSLRRYVNGDKEPEYAGHIIWRCKVDATHLGRFGEIGAFQSGKYFSIALPVPTSDGHNYMMGGVAIAASEDEVVRPHAGATRHVEAFQESSELPNWFLPFVRKTFAQFAGGELLAWIEACATKGKITPTPLFEFKADKVLAGRVLVMGDAAHMASPGTAAGAHTGILDAAGLLEAFTKYPGLTNIDAALRYYEVGGLQRADQLYRRSKEVSRPLKYAPGDEQDRYTC